MNSQFMLQWAVSTTQHVGKRAMKRLKKKGCVGQTCQAVPAVKGIQANTAGMLDFIRLFVLGLGRQACWSLTDRYELGKLLLEVDMRMNQGYGSGARKDIASAVGLGISSVNKYIGFATEMDEAEVEHLSAVRMVNGLPLNWTQVYRLSSIADKEQREELLEKVITEAWTSTELARELRQLKEGVPTRRGRRPTAPTDFRGVVEQMQECITKWKNHDRHIWAKPQFNLMYMASELRPEDITPQLLLAVCSVEEGFGNVEKSARTLRREAEQAAKNMERVLNRSTETPKKGSKTTRS
jgi:hypothetical protein